MGGTDLLAIAICAEKSPHPFSPLWGICHQLSKFVRVKTTLKLQHHAATLINSEGTE
ncbi:MULTISPECIES: hypothetical protein [unclassified Nostoc]|uniref:hypothetical protein n=1 Tax=unclassified Nostoc TaxID=2593658 RepID=UPI001D77DC6B|nr:hypothetical protein [Nostoc sp. JL23]MBN3877776.1 hypothetical protein [Nostoc sp. JL23]